MIDRTRSHPSRTPRPAAGRAVLGLLAALLVPAGARAQLEPVPASERQALIDLYNATNGAGWTRTDHWLGEAGTECHWWGVICTAGPSPSVEEVTLSRNRLTGTIPGTIGNLTKLKKLTLNANQLTGEIPAAIWGLPDLQLLVLDHNQLSGALPAGVGRMSRLVELDLSYNQLTAAIPKEIGNLSSLVNLHLDFNQLTGSLPPEIGKLRSLQLLTLWGNQLTGPIPDEIGDLSSLTALVLAANRLSGSIPTSIGRLTQLAGIGGGLNLSDNQLTGPIPHEIGNCTLLVSVDLHSNQLTGSIPREIGNLTKLQYLGLFENQLSGEIPAEIGNLTALLAANLLNNHLTGPIPRSIGNLTGLQYFYLLGNELTGSIPDTIGNLTKLQYLYLANNQLSGSLPSSLGNLTALKNLDFRGNQLTGPIPDTIGRMTSLQRLYGSLNQLSGPLPGSIGNLTALQVLDLGSNHLAGTIPTGLWGLTSLVTLDLGKNELTGPIPAAVGNLKGLDLLDLDSNPLGGTIPATIGSLTNLTVLHLYGCQLTGTLPKEIGSLTRLKQLNLFGNSLEGPIPKEIGNLTVLEELFLNANKLSGEIPKELGNLKRLTDLFLNDDQLTGVIPTELGNLESLRELSLAGNQLRGAIPASLAGLVTLDAGKLDIRWNALGTGDAKLVGFLDSRQNGGDWRSTQTVSPAGLVAVASGQDSLSVSWKPIAYTADGGYYEVLVGAGPDGPYVPLGKTPDKSASSLSLTGLPPAHTTYVTVRTVTLPHDRNRNTVTSDATAPVAGATPGSPSTLEPTGSRMSASGATGLTFKVQAAAGYAWTALSNVAWVTLTGGRSGTGPGTVTYDVSASSDGPARTGTVTAAGQTFVVSQDGTCPVPDAPTFAVTELRVPGGTPQLVSWTATAQPGGVYRVETSRSASFATLESSWATAATAAMVATASGTTYDLHVRVKALQPCGAVESPYAAPAHLAVTPSAARFVFVTSPLSLLANPVDPAPSATVSVRNTGGTAGRIALSSSADFPQPLAIDPASFDLEPGATRAVTVQVPAALRSAPGTYAGVLTGSFEGEATSLGVRVTVLPVKVDPGSRPDLRVTASEAVVQFSAPEGATPAPSSLVVTVSSVAQGGSTSTDPVYLQARVSDGAWLRVGDALSQPVPVGGVVTLPLSVDRSRRAPGDGVSPFRTLLTIGPVGAVAGDPAASAAVEVVDTVPQPVETGTGSQRKDPPASFLAPSIVDAAGRQGARFTSDGWLRNGSAEAVPVDLYFTPAEADGLLDAGVRKVSLSLPAATTRRLSNLLRTTFGLEGGGSYGPMHVLSPKLEALTLRMLTQSQTGGRPELTFFNELPLVLSGSGIVAPSATVPAGRLLVTGVTEDGADRTNLQLVETSGRAVTATLALRPAAGGAPVATGAVTVPSFGMVQVSAASLLGGQLLRDGTAEVVASGGGSLRVSATRVDNCTNSFTTTVPGPVGQTSSSTPIVFPAIVRAPGLGTFFSTTLRLVNNRPDPADAARLLLTLYSRDGQELVSKNVVLPGAYGTLTEDVVKFLLPDATDAVVGWLLITGETGKIEGGSRAEVTAAVDPANPGGCRLSSPLEPIAMRPGPGETAETYTKGRARTFAGLWKDDGSRNSLVLVETANASGCTVALDLYDRTGQQLAPTTTLSLGPRQYLQVGDLVGSPDGFGLSGLTTFSDLVVTSTVTSDTCRVVPFVTINNNLSRQPLVIPLGLSGSGGAR